MNWKITFLDTTKTWGERLSGALHRIASGGQDVMLTSVFCFLQNSSHNYCPHRSAHQPLRLCGVAGCNGNRKTKIYCVHGGSQRANEKVYTDFLLVQKRNN